ARASNGYDRSGNRAGDGGEKAGHRSLTLTQAIARSCDVYFYQLGLKIGLSRLVAGGVQLGFNKKAGVDLPEEFRPKFPDNLDYFNARYGPRNWTGGAMVMNMAIGQGDNSQSIMNMARFYTALATAGSSPKPEIA